MEPYDITWEEERENLFGKSNKQGEEFNLRMQLTDLARIDVGSMLRLSLVGKRDQSLRSETVSVFSLAFCLHPPYPYLSPHYPLP